MPRTADCRGGAASGDTSSRSVRSATVVMAPTVAATDPGARAETREHRTAGAGPARGAAPTRLRHRPAGLPRALATANVASLQLARAMNRRREFALRAALGAGGGRLIRQLLVEHALVGLIGSGAGLLLAAWLVRALPYLLPSDVSRISDITIDWRVAGFSIGMRGFGP